MTQRFPTGSWLAYPFQVDQRGTLATSAAAGHTRTEMIIQSIISILETRQGERVMVPDYGIPDFVFAVVDAGFSARLAYYVEQQVKRYEPLVDQVRVKPGSLVDGSFTPGLVEDQQSAAIEIEFTERGSNTPRNLVYAVWPTAQRVGSTGSAAPGPSDEYGEGEYGESEYQ